MKKRKLIILSVIIFFILAWNAVWTINYFSYSKLIGGYEKSPGNYYKEKDGYNYSIMYPTYPKLTGNLSVNDNDKLSLFIWPSLIKKTKYGLAIVDPEDMTRVYFYVDSNMQYIRDKEMPYSAKEVKHINTLVSYYSDEILYLKKLADEEWGNFF